MAGLRLAARPDDDDRPLRESQTETDPDLQAVLDVLQDSDCRCIMQAVDEHPLTVAELTDACDLPRTTAYRKVDRLVEASLLETQTRIRTRGHHALQYAPIVSAVTVSIDDDGTVELALS